MHNPLLDSPKTPADFGRGGGGGDTAGRRTSASKPQMNGSTSSTPKQLHASSSTPRVATGGGSSATLLASPKLGASTTSSGGGLTRADQELLYSFGMPPAIANATTTTTTSTTSAAATTPQTSRMNTSTSSHKPPLHYQQQQQQRDDTKTIHSLFTIPSDNVSSGGGVGSSDAMDDLDALLLGTTTTMGRNANSSSNRVAYSNPTSPVQRGVQQQQPQQSSSQLLRGASDGAPPRRPPDATKGSSRVHQFSKESDVCCDAVTRHHFFCFPCAMDDLYRSMNDPGFCPSCAVCGQMALFAFAPPLFYLCCCVQAYAIRGKFSVVINDADRNEPHGCSALLYPCVVTAQVHREIEIRGQPVFNRGCCYGGAEEDDASRVFRGDVYAPAMPDMMTDGRRLPFLQTQPPFAGGALSVDESLTQAAQRATSSPALALPIASDHDCCGKPVVYNSWRHWAVLCVGLPGDLCCGVLTVFTLFTGGN